MQIWGDFCTEMFPRCLSLGDHILEIVICPFLNFRYFGYFLIWYRGQDLGSDSTSVWSLLTICIQCFQIVNVKDQGKPKSKTSAILDSKMKSEQALTSLLSNVNIDSHHTYSRKWV